MGAEILSKATDFSQKNFADSWSEPGTVEALLKTARASDPKAAKYALHGIYEALRGDVTLFGCFDAALEKKKFKEQLDLATDFLTIQKSSNGRIEDAEPVMDKVAWLHSALIGHLSSHFNDDDIKSIVTEVSKSKCSELGKLEAITNLLKAPRFRSQVWAMSEATSIVTEVTAEKPHLLYKCVFAYWMLSFDEATMSQLKGKALKQIASFLLSEVKAERVVRLSLIVLENFLNCKALTEDFANCQILDAVQALEYEKWRDEELYSKIREISQAVAVKVSEVSNFDQYKKELDDALTTGLKRGPLHSAKFWAENCSKLDKSIVTKLKEIVELKRRDDDDDKEQTWSTTIAVACSDLGEIAVLHKDGKEWIKEAKAQDAVMKRLEGHENKIVRREALLCCQKIMLNKWQDVPQKA